MDINPSSPIGVFDSGVGGLTVAAALMQRLPSENIIYFGDTARVPYGIKSVATITQYAKQIVEFLLQQQVKLLIIACNTMAAVARQVVEELSPVPVLEVIDAGARGALSKTHSKRVGVIGTPATINSNAYPQAIHRYDPDIRIISQACPLFVPLVEEGWLTHPATRLTAVEYLKPLLDQRIDTLVLGCTHYPLLKPLLQEIVGPQVQLVDSAESMAEQTEAVLSRTQLKRSQSPPAHHQFHVTDMPFRFREIGERFLGRNLANVQLVHW